ncbi:MAG: 1-(5-phosphoribosyl)-5-[(5-phosphoribosylamino)methylideneamino]imidazole-4-carboxamide isomerase [Candidatus Asgardarchaeia archaeon]|nr:MAG: 1-(5-phosphoribosyl)-5-[(5-phosphoribosylamino)methylideneamino]imidazole-4-carboxamide isomerase [Candidatus Asgardarchaeum californiense]
MLILPAIDLFDGKCVRLVQGVKASYKVYSKEPIAVLQKFKDMGAKMVHIVDMDAVFGAKVDNTEIIKEMTKVGVKLQVGGGIRSLEKAEMFLSMDNVERIVVGSRAITDEDFLISLLDNFGREKIVVAVDYIGTKVLVKGWTETSGLSILEVLDSLWNLDVLYVLATSKEKDGTLKGPDIEGLSNFLRYPAFRVIAAGGISSKIDLEALKNLGTYAAIVGKAYYEGVLNLEEIGFEI